MRLVTCFYAFFLFFISCTAGAVSQYVINDDVLSITLDLLADDYEHVIQQAIVEPFCVQKFFIDADAYVQQKELVHLCGIYDGQDVDADRLTRAIFYLTKKEKFEKAEVRIASCDSGKSMHIHLTSRWTIKKVKCTGIMLGKDLYLSYYLMEAGELFDMQKHHQSMERIRDQLHAQGYCGATVDDTLSYNNQLKSVNISLALACGKRFSTNEIDIVLQAEQLAHDEWRMLKDKIECKFAKRLKGKLYTRELINKETASLKRLLSRKGFLRAHISLTESINYDEHSVQLQFVIDAQKKKEFVFFGNHFFSHEQLLNCIVQFGRAASSLPPSILAEEIERTYHAQGFWHANAGWKEENSRIFFMINEGPRAKVVEVELLGVKSYDAQKLVKDYFADLLLAKQFDPTLLNKAIGDMLSRYANDGYFDARIVNQESVLLGEKGAQQRLVLAVNEGMQYKITKIVVNNFPEVAETFPWDCMYDFESAPACTQDLLNQQKKWLEGKLIAYGYTKAQIKSNLQQDGASVTMIWNIDTSKAQQRFGKTVLVGNDTLDYNIIARELKYAEGDMFDTDQVLASLHKIRSLNVFDHVSLYPEQSDMLLHERPIIVRVVNRDTFEIRLRGGIGLQQMSKPLELVGLTYIIGGSFIVNNATNAADQFCLNLHVTKTYRDIMFRYERPWLFNCPWRLLVQGYSTKYQQPGYFDYKEGLYEVHQNGVLAGIRHCCGALDAAITANFEWLYTNIRREYALVKDRVIAALATDPRLIDRNILYVGLEPTIMLDYTDQKLDPHKGSFTLFSLKGMVPLQHIGAVRTSLKCLFEQSIFIPLRTWVAALRVRLGYMFGPRLPEINLIERFYLGGPHSLRSYYIDCTPPLGEFCDHGKQYCVPQGAKAMANVNAELRIPLFGALGAVLFQDFGWLSNNKQSVVAGGTLLAGTGFGIRYLTPIGPLRFDVGWKWSCHGGCFKNSYAWYLSLGHMF